MKYYLYLLVSVIAYSCNNTTKPQTATEKLPHAVENVDTTTPLQLATELSNTAEADSFVVGNILLPKPYRLNEDEHLADLIDSSWLELYKKDKQYHFGKTNYKIKAWGPDPCSGLDNESIESKNNVLFFTNIAGLSSGNIDSLAIAKPVLQPGEHTSFTFGNRTYKLSASGRRFTDDNSSLNEKSYTITLSIDSKFKRTLLQQSNYNDTQTELIFVGDLDKDGELDFVFSSARDYEEERILIVLSSAPYTYEEAVQFDC